jgi:hypothetical protein
MIQEENIMQEDERWKQDWEKQTPELTGEIADDLVRMFDDIRLFVEQNEVSPVYHADVRREIPTNLHFELPHVGISVHIGHDRGGSVSHKLEDGVRDTREYRTDVDIQVEINAKFDFEEDARFVNLWFDGSHGEHEARVLDAVVRLRDEYVRYLRWYLKLGETEIPVAIETAKMRLCNSAESLRARLAS